MKNANLRSIAIAASAALGMAAISSSASAQPTQEDYCQTYAWNVCSYSPGGVPIFPSQECVQAEYDACMGIIAANEPPAQDKRHEVQLASRPAAATRL